ncbi:cellulose binding domain-containing protein [Rugosimonospora africana]|uniref:cellulose binding domain-containing protein n=1 Tax=Rugosimonospora africana TaxID=556532 RepID=UPI0023B2A603|nr:cellulose binding domain-containing protein [Rugosimonospora africana]
MSPSAPASATASATVRPSSSPSRTVSPSPTTSPTGGTGGAVTATFHNDSDWGSGFTGTVTVRNNGTAAIHSWRVTWTWGGNQQITNSWNATVTSSGRGVTATNASYNGTIAPGGTTTFGFQATYSGTNTPPTLSASGS